MFSLIAILLVIISTVFGISFLFVSFFASVVFFIIASIFIVCLIYSSRSAKKEAKDTIHNPVIITANNAVTFQKVVDTFENLTNEEIQLSASDNVKFFRMNKILKLRIIVYKTENFNKRDFDNAKYGINKKANKELKIMNWVNKFDAVKMMRLNIICTDTLNDILYQFISQNAYNNLTRVEGIINIAVVGNEILIPPLFGNCDLAEIRRYKNVIKFINQILLK